MVHKHTTGVKEAMMQIEKAYLFARQITAGEPPTPPLDAGVYFENGMFNP